ncbi:MAG: hypothetical protein C4293_20545 [Nitrospiraceae bacterium]
MSSADHLLVMRTDGTVEGVYDDAMIPVLSALGRPLIRRAGHVEALAAPRGRRQRGGPPPRG